eukprot:TRINITY_DN678_c0_g1_i2.p1 TRINITY_DN678_c0_g1~~TRINITY_DN678_c0_g1_i2.p1  ORF type:complete len:144 (+),score=49.02 TRINITY_DN678_c0_g1_i2:69-500(+)
MCIRDSVLTGRYAGKKAVILKCNDEGTKDRKYGHALVVGLSKCPRKVNKSMSSKKIEKNISMGVFIKYININHLMPTRYQITGQIDFKTIVQEDKLETNIDDKIKIKSELAKTLKQKYKEMPAIKGPQDKANHLHFFYKKLRF